MLLILKIKSSQNTDPKFQNCIWFFVFPSFLCRNVFKIIGIIFLFPFTHWREYFSSASLFLRIPFLLSPILHALEAAALLPGAPSSPNLLCFLPFLLFRFLVVTQEQTTVLQRNQILCSRFQTGHGHRMLLDKSPYGL